jgi:FkbM family methyltransferase
MINYSIQFNGIDELKKCFHFSQNSKINRKIILRVYNSYLNYKEYEERMELIPNVNYWTYVSSNNKNRYVEFRDEDTLEIVGLFGLDGTHDIEDEDNFKYVKTIFNDLKPGEKHNVYCVFNELTTHNVYNNEYVSVEKNDLVIDIGFNYGLFSLTSLKYKPSKIIAFEPNPKLVKTFTEFYNGNIITLHQKAVSNENGRIVFYENLDPGMSSIFQEINNITRGESYEVEIVNFNDFILHNNIDKIDYLKVDCEGAEYNIFESIPFDFLKDNVKKVAIEFHHQIKDKKVQTLINKLKNCNFTLKIVYEENSNIGLIYGKK